MESCPLVKNILILDSEGKRVAVKYYTDDWPSFSAKLAFEKSVFTKTEKTNGRMEVEIVMFDGYIIVYKFIQDLHFFVTGGDEENELILATVLQGLLDAVALLLRNNVDKRTAFENLDVIFLCLDEIVDRGKIVAQSGRLDADQLVLNMLVWPYRIVLETEASIIAEKAATHGLDGATSFSEQTISQALATAREHLARSLLK
ncbi:coatomer subunit zeta-1-like isoform X1 [Typha latifolia]|uniref:coatomer subunit zeta-1-like isoform X1 n=1 Tax=Typha latifolia TaxID=4733 RepID=UPI003C2EC36E